MSTFSGPAFKSTDAFLFGRTKRGLNKLQRQSRAELRDKARGEFWDQKQEREAAAKEGGA